jgi:hypothetical protein
MFTKEELTNLKALALESSIKAKDSFVVALLLQKLDSLLKEEETPKEEPKEETNA